MSLSKTHLFKLAAALVLVCALALMPQAAQAGKNTPFSADHVTIVPGGAPDVNGKIFVTNGKMRIEMQSPGMPGKMTIIVLQKANKSYAIMEGKKLYVEMPADDSMAASMVDLPAAQKKKLGTESVNGYSCTKYLVTRQMDMMGVKQTVKVTSWEAKGFSYPLRTKSQNGSIQELRNIKKGEPPARLFKLPKGYTKVADMMKLMMSAQ